MPGNKEKVKKQYVMCNVMCNLDECEKVKELESRFNGSEKINIRRTNEIIELKKRVEALEIQLAEAQQWIDSEPDWKDKYNEMYRSLERENKELKEKVGELRAIVNAVDEASDKGAVTPGFWGKVAARQVTRASELESRVKRLGKKLREICSHRHTRNEDWPDGGEVVVCDDCGMSKRVWEQGEGGWQWIEDIPKAREELREALDLIKNGAVRG